MTKNKESIFSVEAVKREQEQAKLQKKVGLETEVNFEKKVPMCITLPPDYKVRLQDYARKKHLTASIVIQMWIDEYCQ